jgi:hypothetical protein
MRRALDWGPRVERARELIGRTASCHGDDFGFFFLRMNGASEALRVMVSSGADEMPWEHASVSLPTRCPTWNEMCWVKGLFWHDTETVVQYHPPKSDYVSFHPFCLHLWKPIGLNLPRPPAVAVGPPTGRAVPR